MQNITAVVVKEVLYKKFIYVFVNAYNYISKKEKRKRKSFLCEWMHECVYVSKSNAIFLSSFNQNSKQKEEQLLLVVVKKDISKYDYKCLFL